jgi:uncharacterized protein
MIATVDETLFPELPEVVRRLVGVLEPERIYLFGSAARGDADQDSDLDLLVIVSDDDKIDQHRLAQAYMALWGISTPADIVVQTRDHFESRAHVKASLPGTVVREGKLVYVRD